MQVEPEHLLPVKMGRPKRVERLAVAERDAAAARMQAKGESLSEIADALGYASKGAASTAIKRAHAAVRAQGAEEHRASHRATLTAVLEEAWNRYQNPGYKYSSTTGAPMKNPVTGEPVEDQDIRDKMLNVILKAVAKQIELEGTASPKRTITANFTIEQRQQIEQEILMSSKRLAGQAEITYDAEIVEDPE
jgi:hypothetical protein